MQRVADKRFLYVGGLGDGTAQALTATVRAAFIPFGNIRSLDIPMDFAKGTCRGFAFVEYEEESDAAEALYNMDGAELAGGKALNCKIAKPQGINAKSNKPIWSTEEWFQDKEVIEGEKRKADGEIMKESNPIES
jgi:peptidyl-prolyl isomerase E (cyclophilin E)